MSTKSSDSSAGQMTSRSSVQSFVGRIRSLRRALLALFRAHMRMGGRPARIVATVGMRDGMVWSKGFSVIIETFRKNGPWTSFDGGSVEYTLMANSHRVPQNAVTERNEPESSSPWNRSGFHGK